MGLRSMALGHQLWAIDRLGSRTTPVERASCVRGAATRPPRSTLEPVAEELEMLCLLCWGYNAGPPSHDRPITVSLCCALCVDCHHCQRISPRMRNCPRANVQTMGLDSPTTETGTALPDHIGMQLRLLGNRAQVLGVGLQSHIDRARQAVEDRWAHGARRRQAQRVAPFAAIAAPAGAHAGSKEELGRATWTLLHTMAAQFPDRPAPSQQRDVKNLVRGATATPCGS